jgi:hypothetical protein
MHKKDTLQDLDKMIDLVSNDFKNISYIELVNLCTDLTMQIYITYEQAQKQK